MGSNILILVHRLIFQSFQSLSTVKKHSVPGLFYIFLGMYYSTSWLFYIFTASTIFTNISNLLFLAIVFKPILAPRKNNFLKSIFLFWYTFWKIGITATGKNYATKVTNIWLTGPTPSLHLLRSSSGSSRNSSYQIPYVNSLDPQKTLKCRVSDSFQENNVL